MKALKEVFPPAARAAAIADIDRWCSQGQLIHAIGAVFPLERIAEAHEALENKSVIGKVLVSLA